MDQFYGSIYEHIIYLWLIGHKDDFAKKHIYLEIDSQYSQRLIFTYHHFQGIIEFWSKQHIIEEIILNDKEELLFYLHYNLTNLSSFKQFIEAFFQQLTSYSQTQHIGMICLQNDMNQTFVKKMKELISFMNLPYIFESISIDDIQKDSYQYDLILLEPQLKYLEPQIMSYCHDYHLVQTIDPMIYATQHYQQLLNQIKKQMT